MNFKLVVVLFVAILSFITVRLLKKTHSLPDLDKHRYWGPGNGKNYVEDTSIRPFKIAYDQEEINDLKRILDQPLRLQEPLEGVNFRYGFGAKQLKSIVKYWRDVYLPQWKTREAYLNQFEQYKTQINGLDIHFIHAKPKKPAPGDDYVTIPLLLLHGWPGSVREFYDFIPKLTSYSKDHKFVFEVVAPSLVGYGFSSAAAKVNFAHYEMAIVFHNLMVRLGYNRYMTQGGDLGAIILSSLATIYPDNIIGYHSNMCTLLTPTALIKSLIASLCPTLFVKEENLHFHFPLKEKFSMLIRESGYFHIQATKPETIGIALAASPIGLAAYILEKFSTGTSLENLHREDGGLDALDMVALLDNVMIYYLTNTITSAVRLYFEYMASQSRIPFDKIPSAAPMGCVRFKNDLPPPFDWQLKDKFPNTIHNTYINHGGHFAAMQSPEDLYNDFIEFVGKVPTTK